MDTPIYLKSAVQYCELMSNDARTHNILDMRCSNVNNNNNNKI